MSRKLSVRELNVDVNVGMRECASRKRDLTTGGLNKTATNVAN